MRKKKQSPLLWGMVVIGVLCSLIMLTGRISAELESNQVACAIHYNDILLLSQTDGRAPEDWLADMNQAGVHYLIVPDGEGDLVEGMARSGKTAQPGDAFLLPPPPPRGYKGYDTPGMPRGDSSVPLALVENYHRTGVVMPDQFDPEDWEGPMVKTLYMYDAYSYHYQKHGDAPSENENILFRAVTDRGMRLIVVTPLEYEGGGVVADPAAYQDMLSGLGERLESRGLTLGEEFSPLDAPRRNPLLLAGAALLPAALAVLLLCLTIPASPALEHILLVLGILIAAGGAFLLPDLLQTLVAFGAAVLAPCYTALLFRSISSGQEDGLCELPLWARYPAALAAVAAISLAGGLYVGALLATRSYMLEFQVFTGVKLAQLLPLVATVLILGPVLRRRPAGRRVPGFLLVLMALCVAAALVLLVLRSGDNMLPVAKLETAARTWLELALYARPRTKEMLMAFPVLAFFLVAADRRAPLLELPLAVLAEVGSVSVVNTFCHIFTPVHVSFIRTLLSAGIGLVLGYAAMGVFCLLLQRKKL